MIGITKSIFKRALSILLMVTLLAVTFTTQANARFISPDDWDPTMPGVGTNRYAYSQQDPVNKSDPNGHAICGGICIGILVGTVAAWLMSDVPANAPSTNDPIEQKSNLEVGGAMLEGASVGAGLSAGIKAFAATKGGRKNNRSANDADAQR